MNAHEMIHLARVGDPYVTHYGDGIRIQRAARKTLAARTSTRLPALGEKQSDPTATRIARLRALAIARNEYKANHV